MTRNELKKRLRGESCYNCELRETLPIMEPEGGRHSWCRRKDSSDTAFAGRAVHCENALPESLICEHWTEDKRIHLDLVSYPFKIVPKKLNITWTQMKDEDLKLTFNSEPEPTEEEMEMFKKLLGKWDKEQSEHNLDK